MNRILTDQDSRFGMNMLDLDISEEEDKEIARLKSIGFTAIEALSTIFERRMLTKVREVLVSTE